MSKVVLTKAQANMIENHRNNFELLMQKRHWINCPTSIDNLSVEGILSAFFDGYDIKKEWYETRDALELTGDADIILFMSNNNNWIDKDEKYPLLVSMKSEDSKTFTGLTVSQMKQIKNYLEEKINYLTY